MTVREAIERGAVLYPADLDSDKVYIFLTELESRIRTELFGEDGVSITENDAEMPLKASGAHAQIYPLYIAARRELVCGDADRYSFFNSVFEQAYSDYANYVNRCVSPADAVYIKNI